MKPVSLKIESVRSRTEHTTLRKENRPRALKEVWVALDHGDEGGEMEE